MKKFSIIIGVFLITISAFALFQIKYQVQELRRDLTEIKKQIIDEQEAIRVLNAEWTYLNQPERLSKLVAKHLDMQSIKPDQVQNTVVNANLVKKKQNSYEDTIKVMFNEDGGDN
jgi:cell division protein FtsL